MSENNFRSHFWPFQINTKLLFLFYKMVSGAHFGCPKFTFDRISDQYTTLIVFEIFIFVNFTKWLPAAILDVRKSLSVAFLAISDQYATFFNFIFTKWLPSAILDGRNLLWITFLAILDQYRFQFFNFVTKWLPVAILDVRNSLWITFLAMLDQYRFIFLIFFASLSIAFLAISDRYATLICFEIVDKMVDIGHFGCPKFTFDRISGHFRSKQIFFAAAILDV